MIGEIINLAELEIRTTSMNAVKAITKELGGELAYEKTRADTYENLTHELHIENECLKHEVKKKKIKAFFWGALTSSITIFAIKGFMTLGGN